MSRQQQQIKYWYTFQNKQLHVSWKEIITKTELYNFGFNSHRSGFFLLNMETWMKTEFYAAWMGAIETKNNLQYGQITSNMDK